MARSNHEEVWGRPDALVLREGVREHLRTVVVAALADELRGISSPATSNLCDPFVYFAQQNLVSNELFERDGQHSSSLSVEG